MTGRIFEVKHFSVHDGPGIRTTIFLKGCPLSCIWCHNPEGISKKPEIAFIEKKCSGCGACIQECPNHAQLIDTDGRRIFNRKQCIICGKCTKVCYPQALMLYGRELTVDEAMEEILPDTDFYTNSGGGVTLSGGEPLLQADFSAEVLKSCKEHGIKTAVDTSGYVSWDAIEKVLDDTDLFLYDLKHMDSGMHAHYTGVSNERILENLMKLGKLGKAIEIRIPVIPGVNDGRDNMIKAALFLNTIPGITAVRLLRYHSMARSKYASIAKPDTMPDADSPSEEEMEVLSEVFKLQGLMVIY